MASSFSKRNDNQVANTTGLKPKSRQLYPDFRENELVFMELQPHFLYITFI